MKRCDVVVVGGGPAGSTVAWKLRQGGLDVVVLDKERFPRDKICAGWITPAVVQSLQLDLDDYRNSRVLQPISGFRIASMGAMPVEVSYREAVSYGIRRVEFDEYLLGRTNARLLLGQRLERLERKNAGWLINGELKTPLVVGAGGHFCPVARAMGRQQYHEVVVAAQEVEFEMTEAERRSCAVREEVPELYFCEDLKGYGWCFRKGNYLNIGLGREDRHRLGEHVNGFVEMLRRSGRVGFDLRKRMGGHAYLLYGRAGRKPVDDGVLLVGDAAGLAYAQSGEGIRPAIESGLMAAEEIIGAEGDYRGARLQGYERRLRARFGEPSPSQGIRGPQGLKQALARRLLATRWFARKVVLDRWFLHADQEPLSRPLIG